MKTKDSIFENIKKKIRKKILFSDFYKTEKPEHLIAAISSSKETVVLSFILIIIFSQIHLPLTKIKIIYFTFLIGFIFWKSCQTAFLGWIRLNKFHKIIKEEKYEIEHHRENERKELETIYKAKGFSGKLLNDVIDVLMADDNRLLQVMMEEEMGLILRRYEHPLKQAIFALLGVLFASFFLILTLNKPYEFFLLGTFIFILSSIYSKTNISFEILWNLAILALISIISFFSIKYLMLIL